MRSKGTATGEQFAQVDNPDPFAPPVWRSPVYRTPEAVISLVQLTRLLARVLWFVICHPLLDMAAGLVILDWLNLGWPGLAALAGLILAVLVVLRLAWPALFARLVTGTDAGWVAALVLPAPLARGDDDYRPRTAVSRPGPGARAGPGGGGRPGGPGDGAPGDRAGPGRLRHPGRSHRARLRRPPMPGPLGGTRPRRTGAGPPGRTRRAGPGTAHPGTGGP